MPGFVPWKKVNPSQKRADQKRRLEELLNKIFDHYFAALWPLTLQSSAAKDTLFSFFEKKIALLLNFSHTDGPGALLGVFYKSAKPNDRNFNKFDRCLRVIFLSEVPITAPYKSIDKNDLAQICCNAIVSALQEATFFTPACIYNGIERIPDAAITTLTNILKHVDQLVHRHRFSIAYPDMSRAQTRLYQEVARVDGFVSLPLLRLPTSALAATELAKFCVGRNTLSDRLARYIVKNDGVMLIAGYRGVGKSTFVNSVISKLPTFEKHQGSAGQWHLIPIQINVAKADSVINVLRLCVRAIYRTFFVDDPQKTHHDLEKLLDKKEKYLLKWANLCAIRKVDMKWSESISSLRSIEASLDLKPGDLLPKPISASPLKTLLPGFAVNADLLLYYFC